MCVAPSPGITWIPNATLPRETRQHVTHFGRTLHNRLRRSGHIQGIPGMAHRSHYVRSCSQSKSSAPRPSTCAVCWHSALRTRSNPTFYNPHPRRMNMENLTLDIETLDSADTLTWKTVGTSSDILTAMHERMHERMPLVVPFTDADLDWFRRPLNATSDTSTNGGAL